jgi:hypothetical protein
MGSAGTGLAVLGTVTPTETLAPPTVTPVETDAALLAVDAVPLPTETCVSCTPTFSGPTVTDTPGSVSACATAGP